MKAKGVMDELTGKVIETIVFFSLNSFVASLKVTSNHLLLFTHFKHFTDVDLLILETLIKSKEIFSI
jgi:hypothetical protein